MCLFLLWYKVISKASILPFTVHRSPITIISILLPFGIFCQNVDFGCNNSPDFTVIGVIMTERLRIDEKVLGYRRLQGKHWFYSPDMYSWSGNAIVFKQSDRSTGIRDRNRRLIFENDILEDNELGFFEIAFDEALGRLFVVALQENGLFSLDWLAERSGNNSFVWKSFSFLQGP